MNNEPLRFTICRTTGFYVGYSKCNNYTYWLHFLTLGFFGIMVNLKKSRKEIDQVMLHESAKRLTSLFPINNN